MSPNVIIYAACFIVLLAILLGLLLKQKRQAEDRADYISKVGVNKFLAIGRQTYIEAMQKTSNEYDRPLTYAEAKRLWNIACIGASKGTLSNEAIEYFFKRHIIGELRKRRIVK